MVNDEAFTLQYRGPNLKGLLCGLLKCEKQKVRIWTVTFMADEPLPKRNTVKLTKPLKPGFRRPFEITPDEAVDINDSGTYVKVEVIAGDSTVTIDPASTATSIKGWLNGDGATGDKAVRFTADGHIGDGDQPVSLDVEYSVATPDATILGFKEGTDEAIPT